MTDLPIPNYLLEFMNNLYYSYKLDKKYLENLAINSKIVIQLIGGKR